MRKRISTKEDINIQVKENWKIAVKQRTLREELEVEGNKKEVQQDLEQWGQPSPSTLLPNSTSHLKIPTDGKKRD